MIVRKSLLAATAILGTAVVANAGTTANEEVGLMKHDPAALEAFKATDVVVVPPADARTAGVIESQQPGAAQATISGAFSDFLASDTDKASE